MNEKTEHDAKLDALTACYNTRRDIGQDHEAAINGMRAMSTEHNIDAAMLDEVERLVTD